MVWEQLVAENEPSFERLKEQESQGPLELAEQNSLKHHAQLLEAAYILGAEEITSNSDGRKIELFEKAKEFIPYVGSDDVTLLMLHVEVCLGTNDVILGHQYASEAQRLIESGVEVSQDVQQDVLSRLGFLRESQGKYAEAAEYYICAIEVDPDSEDAISYRRNAALSFFDAGLYSEAIPQLQVVVSQEPDGSFSQQLLCECYEREGRWNDSIDLYQSQLGRATRRDAIEHLSGRIGFCEARRDSSRPTGAPVDMAASIVSLKDEISEDGNLTDQELTRMQIIKSEQRMIKYIEEKSRLAFSAVIEPHNPFSNLSNLRQALRACEQYIWWADPHFQSRALEQLAEVVDQERLQEIRILSSFNVVEEFDRRNWQLFVKEMTGKGIRAEWRTTEKRLMHDRFIIGANIAFNVPPVGTLFTGTYAEISVTENRPPFDEWWRQSQTIRSRN